MGKILVVLFRFILKTAKLSTDEKNLCITMLLTNLNYLPISDSIKYNQRGVLLINNKPLEVDEAIRVRLEAKTLRESRLRQLIRDQVTYLAINVGIHQASNAEQMYFAKAALWWKQEEEKLLETLGGQDDSHELTV